MRVLALARADDPCLPPVADAIARLGGELIRVDLGDFPARLPLSLSATEDGDDARFGDQSLNDAAALWVRTVDVATELPPMESEHKDATVALANTALHAALQCVDIFQLDPPEALGTAPLKPRQAQLARRMGLSAPRTLISNDPVAIRTFAARCGGELIAKMLDSGTVMMADGEDAVPFPTMLLGPEELESLEGIELSPMIFQEFVPKVREARVTIVGHERFVAAVEVGQIVDVRQPEFLRALRPYPDMPEAVLAGLERLMDRVGLNFATFDLVQTPDDRWVFLEMNTISYFHHVERYAGLPISDSVARLLLGLAPRRGGA